MKAQNRVTKHGKKRVGQRVNTSQKANSLARIVSKNGKSKGMYQGKFHQYLVSKSISGARIKVYQGNIYLLSKNTKRLITTYQIPDKYLPIEQYEISNRILSLSYLVKSYMYKPVIVNLNDGTIYKGYIDEGYGRELISNFVLITESENVLIELSNVKKIEIDLEKYKDLIEV